MLSSAISSSVFKAGTVFGAIAIALTVGSSVRAATVFDVTGSMYEVLGEKTNGAETFETSALAELSGTVTYDEIDGFSGIDVLLDFVDDAFSDVQFSYIARSSSDYYLAISNQPDGLDPLLIFDPIVLNPNSPSLVSFYNSATNTRADILSGSATFTPRTAVPTPAMLPALVGLGVTTWRRRQGKKLTTA